jgi:predicted nuclease of predicted toxin-antitoxin system
MSCPTRNSSSVDFLADERVDGRIIRARRLAGLRMASVREDNPGLADRDVLSLALRMNSVVVTEDSDSGDWVFAHQEPTVGVNFLRYRHNERERI